MAPSPSAVPACGDPACLERAQVLVSRSSRHAPVPLCDRHTHVAVVEAERFRVPLVLTGLPWAAAHAGG